MDSICRVRTIHSDVNVTFAKRFNAIVDVFSVYLEKTLNKSMITITITILMIIYYGFRALQEIDALFTL